MPTRAVVRRLAASLWLSLSIVASACQGGSGSSGKHDHDPAPTDIDGTLGPCAGLCPRRQAELAAALCPSEPRTVELGGRSFVAEDGTPWGSSAVVPAYGGVVLFPAEWMTDPEPG